MQISIIRECRVLPQGATYLASTHKVRSLSLGGKEVKLGVSSITSVNQHKLWKLRLGRHKIIIFIASIGAAVTYPTDRKKTGSATVKKAGMYGYFRDLGDKLCSHVTLLEPSEVAIMVIIVAPIDTLF